MIKSLLFSLLFSCLAVLYSCSEQDISMIASVSSPDSIIGVKFICDSSGRMAYSISYQQKEIILPSNIALDFKSMPTIQNNLKIVNVTTDSVNEKWERVWGKRKQVTNRYNQVKVELQEIKKPRRKLNLYFRAYNDGVAIRYELPAQKG